jgi:hypothetical protein
VKLIKLNLQINSRLSAGYGNGEQLQFPEPKTCVEVLCAVMSLVTKYFLQKLAMLSHAIRTFCSNVVSPDM